MIFRVFDVKNNAYLDELGPDWFKQVVGAGGRPSYFTAKGLGKGFVYEPFIGHFDMTGDMVFLGDVLQDQNGTEGSVVWNEEDASYCVLFPGVECMPVDSLVTWATIVGTVHDHEIGD